MANFTYITTTGIIVPDTGSILTDVTAEYTSTFGTQLVTTPDSPAGVLITAETLARTEVIQSQASTANQLNPNISAGTYLDAIMALTGIQRASATQTYVSGVALTGAAGTSIPQGSLAQTAAGDQFETVAPVVLSIGGTATVDFQSVQVGPVPCAADALNTIVSAILGWETVDNTSPGVVGSSTQSDVAARALRNNTLGFQGVALPVAITSALYNIPGITSVWFQENVAATTQTINGVSMVGHSIYVVVNGGANLTIAAALLENKSNGCAWVGGTSVDVVEPASGQTYTVKFDHATPVEISVAVTTPNGDDVDIKNAILAYMAGTVPNFPLSNGSGWSIGGILSCFEISAAIVAQFPAFTIKNVEIKKTIGGTLATTPLTAAVNEIFYTSSSVISVTIG